MSIQFAPLAADVPYLVEDGTRQGLETKITTELAKGNVLLSPDAQPVMSPGSDPTKEIWTMCMFKPLS